MFNILLILIFVGGIVIAAVFAGITFLQGVRSAQEIQITKQRLVETAARIQAQARYLSGYIALPRGGIGSSPYGYNQVPSWISSNARNAAGVPFLYCPYRSTSNGGTSGTVTMPSGATYNISYTNNIYTMGYNYVTAGDAPDSDTPAGTIGVLIAAAPQSNQPPNCNSITAASDGTPIATGGIVVPIMNNSLNKMKVATAPTELRIYINLAASGDGSGRDTNNYAELGNAMVFLNYTKPAQVTIVVPTGTHSTASSISWGGRVHIEGATAGTSTFRITSNTINEFSLVSIRNVTLTNIAGSAMTINGEVQMESANLTSSNGILIYGGKLTSIGTNTITGNITIDGGGTMANANGSAMSIAGLTNRGFSLINGSFFADGGSVSLGTSTASIAMGYIGAGGNLQTAGAFNFNSAAALTIKGGMVVDPGGRAGVAQSGGAFIVSRYNDYAFYVHGNLDLTVAGYLRSLVATGATLTYGAVLASGGALLHSQSDSIVVIGSTAFATRPNTALYDNGGNRFHMNGTATIGTIQGRTACWSGRSGTNLFSDPFSGTHTGTTTGHVSYTNDSATYKWLRLYNQSYLSCTVL